MERVAGSSAELAGFFEFCLGVARAALSVGNEPAEKFNYGLLARFLHHVIASAELDPDLMGLGAQESKVGLRCRQRWHRKAPQVIHRYFSGAGVST